MNYFAIFCGAGIGALLRHGLQSAFARYEGWQSMLGVLLANIIGCFLIGLAFSFTDQLPDAVRLLLITGFLGALTTFSSFSLDINLLMAEGQRLPAVGLAIGHLIGGLGACQLGLWLTRPQFYS